jgi:hypothetical protein
MIGAGRPSVAAGGHGTPGQLNARTGGRGYSAHSFSQGSALPGRRSGGAGMGMAGVPQPGQFRANTEQFRGQGMARGMSGANIPNFGGRR